MSAFSRVRPSGAEISTQLSPLNSSVNELVAAAGRAIGVIEAMNGAPGLARTGAAGTALPTGSAGGTAAGTMSSEAVFGARSANPPFAAYHTGTARTAVMTT